MKYEMLDLGTIRSLCEKALEKDRVVSVDATVTPDIARYILENYNTENFRDLNYKKVREYAGQMEAGKWSDAASVVLFAGRSPEHLRLKDGQHRLAAVAESETSQVFTFSFGHGGKIDLRVDTGLPRTTAQTLAFIGVERTEDGSVGKLPKGTPNAFYLFRNMSAALPHGVLRGDALAEAWNSPANRVFRENIEHAIDFLSTRASDTGATATVLAAVYIRLLAAGASREDIEEFINGLAGINVGEHDPRRRCSLYLKGQNTTGRTGEGIALRALFYTWDRWMRGDTIQKFYAATADWPKTIRTIRKTQ